VALVALVVAAGCVLALGQGLKYVVDKGFGSADRELLNAALAAMIGVGGAAVGGDLPALLPDDEHSASAWSPTCGARCSTTSSRSSRLLRGDAHRRGDLAPHQRHHAAAAGDRLRPVDVRAQPADDAGAAVMMFVVSWKLALFVLLGIPPR
jgi:hypothetical protein